VVVVGEVADSAVADEANLLQFFNIITLISLTYNRTELFSIS